jgi:8-amino-3,8-dideoxy-alpha-D-manno-octulosonate transaminase
MPGYEFIGAEEKKHINDVLETGILMRYGFDGPRKGIWKSKELENAISQKFNVKHAQLLSSGTAALSTALAVMGVGAGDEVIMPTFTFVASFEAIISVGAIPVLVDIDETLTLDPKCVEAAITPNTKVVMPVHMCGSMCQMDELLAICERHQLLLLEDACQAIGGSYKGKSLGTIGNMGTYSFDFVKIMTCGEGGAVITNNSQLATLADQYTDHGHDHYGKDRGADLHPFLGYNYRISELHAAIGLAQIEKVDGFLKIQKQYHKYLKERLSTIEGITFRVIPDESGDTCSFLSFFLPTAQQAQQAAIALAEAGIAGNPYWYDNNWHYIRKWDHLKNANTMNSLYESQKQGIIAATNKTFEQSDAIMSRCISSAINLTWTEQQLKERADKMVDIISQVLKN